MSLAEDYRPCRNCGTLTDSGVCSYECVRELEYVEEQRKRFAAGEIDEEGNELGDYCTWCGTWFAYEISLGPYCDDPSCRIEAERD
jgi:hypothetical protein